MPLNYECIFFIGMNYVSDSYVSLLKSYQFKNLPLDPELKYHIVNNSRQNERYRLVTHANYYKWQKTFDIRPHLPYFAGIGVEKLYLFYTHVMHMLDIEHLSDDRNLLLDDFDEHGNKFNQHEKVWSDMLLMVKDPLFVRKLRQLNKYTEDDIKNIDNRGFNAGPSIIKGMQKFGFDRRQALYFIVDIALHSFQEPTVLNGYTIFTVKNIGPFADLFYYQILSGDWSRKFRIHALKTLYSRKVENPNDPNGGLYELNFDRIQAHNHMVFFNDDYDEVIDRVRISYERYKRRERKQVKPYQKVRHHKPIKLDKRNKMSKKGLLR